MSVWAWLRVSRDLYRKLGVPVREGAKLVHLLFTFLGREEFVCGRLELFVHIACGALKLDVDVARRLLGVRH